MAHIVNAASLGLSVNPPITVINVIPPTSTTSQISIQNNGDTQTVFQIQIKPFKAKGENGELEYSREALPIIKDIQILDAGTPVESVTLDPKQEKKLSLNINIPQNITISDYYFSIIFISTNSHSEESNSTINQLGIATNVLLSVGQKEDPEAILQDFSTKVFLEEGPVPFTVRVNNIGNQMITPKGEILIKNMFGQSVGRLSLSDVNILANSIRAIPSDFSDFSHPVAVWKEGFLLGLYSATLSLSLSNDGPTFTRTIHFFAFPLQILIIIVIIAIIAIILKNRFDLYANKDRT